MRKLLYAIAIFFFVGWILGLIIFNERTLVHILLVLAVFTSVLNFLLVEESKDNNYEKRKPSKTS
ncbi:DUF5670 family protein [Pseudopedobacter beijingensis]|uniref:DUF5670 family protein n=1 Tax=Pseudopedobacter beijingensis TaxID=1207056 RepID=A0ABW4IFB0_9SPHI